MSAFGASSTPAFGNSGTSIFGGTSSGVFGASLATSPFSSTTTFGASSSPAFGNAMSAFGSSSTPAFGSSGTSIFGGTSTGVFGASLATSPFSSTTTFGASSSPAFGNTMSAFGSSSTPAFGSSSSALGGSSVFGQKPAFRGFGSSPAQASPFKSTGQQSQPAFGSSVFGSSSPFAGTSQFPFGSTSTPAFGSTSILGFGATSTPAVGPRSTPVFGATSPPPFGAATTPAFGFTSTVGSGGAFGAPKSPLFGSPSNSAFGVSTTPAFGASPSAFGASTPAFGSNVFGARSTTAAFGSTTFDHKPFGSQRGGTSIAACIPTTEPDGGSGSHGAGKLESISAMPIYKDKCHEEWRWEDYQLGDKGGPLPAGSSTAPVGFNASTPSQPNLLTPTFGQTPANPISTLTTSNPFAPKASVFGTPSTLSFSSSAFAPSTSSNLFGAAVSPSTSSFGVSPSFFNSSSTPAFGSQPGVGSATTAGSMPSFGSSINIGNTLSSSLLPSTTPTLWETGSSFRPRPSTSAFGCSITSSSLFSQPTSVFGGHLFSSTQPLMPSSTPAFGESSCPLYRSANHTSAVAQPHPVSNPFGTLPEMPQMTTDRAGNASLMQYGISSMPVIDKPSPLKTSSLLTSRPLSQRRIRLSAGKYHPKNDVIKVPFFSEDKETPSTQKADALFIPRENPRALVIRPTEHWPAKASAEKASLTNNTSRLHVNGKNTEETSLQRDSSISNEDGDSATDGPEKDLDQHTIVNQKTNGFNEHNTNEKGKTLGGHGAGEAAIAYEHGADVEALMPKLRHADYYTEPKIQELAAKERAEPGFCHHVKDFVVGRHGFGSIKFMGETNVRRIDLESIVQFNNREVIVYMDDSKKPPVGQGLNKPAEVTLLNVKCVDKKTGRQYTEGPRVEKYKEMLERKAEDQGAEFVSYDSVEGEWKFKVNHFS